MSQRDERSGWVEFRILGPLRVTDGGSPVDTPRGVEARLLASLLLEPGQAWSLSRLVDYVWDDEPPATAERQVRNLVSGLRKKLGARRILNVGNGYQFSLDGAEIDARRFAAMVQRARDSRATGDGHRALNLLREALELWYGEPLRGMRGQRIAAASRQLADTRLTTLEDWADLELELGDPGSVVPPLRKVLAANPNRQRTAGQLMLALHRLQRTPEALAVYRLLCSRLAEDLGLDPSEQLQEQQRAILRGDTEPEPGPAAPAARVPAPAQLPAAPAGFVGRADKLTALDELRSGRGRSCTITGAAGTGKTALAVHWAHRIRDHYPDGQLFLNLRGFDHGEPVGVTEALGRLIRSLRGPEHPVPENLDEATATYRTLSHDKKILVVLDNARDAAQVRPLLSPGADGFTLITSRHRLGGLTALNAVAPLSLPPLSPRESVELLHGANRRHLDTAAAHRLAQLCGHLPLALRIAAAQLTSAIDADRLIEQLDSPGRLDVLGIEDDPHATVTTALEQSCRHLDTETRNLFLTLGLLPGDDYASDLILAVSGADPHAARRRLDHLEAMHLLEQHHPDRYRFHDLTRLYAAGQAVAHLAPAAVSAAVDTFVDWHYGRRDVAAAAEDTNLMLACDVLADHPRLWRLVTALARRATGAGRLERIPELIEAGTASAEDDPLGQCYMASALASYHWARDSSVEAIDAGRRAVELAEGLDEEALWMATGQLGLCLFGAGRFTEAATRLEQSLVLTPASVDWHRRFNQRLDLSAVRLGLGQFEQARRIHGELAREAAERRSPEHEFRAKAASAWLHWDTGDHAAANELATTALAGARRAGNHRYECELRKLLAMVHAAAGDTEAAVRGFEQVIDISRQIQRPSFQVEAVCELSKLYSAIGEPDRARGYLEQLASVPADEAADPMSVAEIALTHCIVHNGLNEHRAALPHGITAVRLTAAIPWPLRHAQALAELADAHAGIGEPDTAQRLREQAQDILGDLGLR